jgi:2-amino-4-hydroxy-6-hydroxymethyldihydropteridine diphosphokinase
MVTVFILSGSNINPVTNTRQALALLRRQVEVLQTSNAWESRAVGSPGPNFLNLAVKALTDRSYDDLKFCVLREIEAKLGRVRSSDKNSPRPIDLDIILYDGQVTDPNIWTRAHVAIPMADLIPNLVHPQTGQVLGSISADLLKLFGPVQRQDLCF